MATETDSTVITAMEAYVKANYRKSVTHAGWGGTITLDYDYIKNTLNMDTFVQTVLGYGIDDDRSDNWNERQRQRLLKLKHVAKSRKRYS